MPAERNRPEDAPIGLIPVDSLYSPVKRVSYKVENTREGQILDYDKLTLTLETDGSVSPEDALAFSARILAGSASGVHQLSKSRLRSKCRKPSRSWNSTLLC